MGGIGPQSSSLSTRNSMAPLFGDFFSFKSGVHVSRLSTHRLKGINPEREKAYNVGRNRIFDSRHDLHVYNLERRKLAVRKDPLTLGELIPKTKHMIFSENPVKDYEAVIDPVSVENDISQEMSVINEYYYNSPMNGQKFKSVGSDGSEVVVKIDNAVSSPWDRTGTDIPAERRLKTKEGNSIFYGGRPDTDERVRWQGIDIFLSELKSGFKKGFKEIVEEENLDGSPKEVHVQMTYLVDSLTNPTVGLTKWRRLPLISQFVGDALDERDSLKWERKALEKAYRSHSPITLDVDGVTYKLTLKPIHAHTTISCFSELRKQIRRGTLSGTVLENDINRRAFRRLLRYYRHSGLNDPIANEIITKFRSSRYNSVNLPPHIRLTMVDMLARICGLPIVHHCKSVVDRTSVAAAVSVVNQMILEKKLPLKGTFEETIGGELYKELFLRALQTQLPVSIDVRSAVNEDGTLNRKRDFPGSNLRDGVFAAFGVIPLFPDRALRDITTYEKVSFFVKAFFVALFSLFIIGSPKWLEPTKTFDMNSFALSEDGARPLLCKAKHTCSAALNRKGATPGVKDREIFQRKLENIPEGFLSAQGLAALNLSLTHLTENHPIRKTISPAERFLPNKTENNFTEFAERTILLIDGRRMIDANSFPQNLTLENCRDIVVKTLQEAMPAEAIDLEGIRARFNIERKKQLVEATLLCPIYSEGNKLKFTVKCKL
ncbi:MAG: hypothetical protein ACOYK9_06885, partial [Chlamydiia bacterium]